MDKSFDPDAFIRRIGERLVERFMDAKAGTTPSTVGSAAEQPVRDQLEQVLPRGVAVGEGFVIDSYGVTSRQQDVVLYERDICPVFSINRAPNTTYYPCEGVIATGEIKSLLDRASLQDAFNKVVSVKALQRHTVTHPVPHPKTGEPVPLKRNYLSPHGDSVLKLDERSEQKERAQIFGFILAGESRLTCDSLVATFSALSAGVDERLLPNLLVTLDGYAVRWGKIAREERKEIRKSSEHGTYGMTVYKDGPERWQESWSAATATHVGGSEQPDAFRMLIRWIRQRVELGRTSHVRAFNRYFEANSMERSTPLLCIPKLPAPREGQT